MQQTVPNLHRVVTEIINADLSAGDALQLKVISQSMSPLMQRGDAVRVEIAPLEQISRGEVVLVQRENDYLTHRLIHKSAQKWQTKGDNNRLPDPPASGNRLIGRVTRIQRGDKITSLQTRKWQIINLLLAQLGTWEWQAFAIHRYFRLPFRLSIRIIQRIFMP